MISLLIKNILLDNMAWCFMCLWLGRIGGITSRMYWIYCSRKCSDTIFQPVIYVNMFSLICGHYQVLILFVFRKQTLLSKYI